MLQKLDTAIAEVYFTEIGDYGQLIKLLRTDDAKSYRTIGKAFNFVIAQYNSLITRHLFINEMGEQAKSITPLRLDGLLIQSVEQVIWLKLGELEQKLKFVTEALDLMGIELQTKPFPDEVIGRGYAITSHLAESNLATTQGAGFDDEYIYAFGTTKGSGSPTFLTVTHKTDPDKSFIAKGSLGNWVSGGGAADPNNYHNALGHANDCAVVEKKDDEVTLLVASMIPKEMATCVVNLKTQEARIGVRTPIFGFEKEVVASVQQLPNGQVMVRASGYYTTERYDEKGMTFTRIAQHPNMTNVVNALGFAHKASYQADWLEGDYIYVSVWLSKLKKSLIVETIPQGPDQPAIISNRYWWDEEAGRRFEIEKVWIDDGVMYANMSLDKPYENYIIKPQWKEKNE